MSLIEQLGCYSAAKNWLDKNEIHVKHGYMEKYQRELLEYRRAHNIFEVGDNVVLVGGGTWEHLFEVEKMSPKGRKPTKLKTDVFGNYHVGYNIVRHATDLEIAARHRL